MAYKKLQVKYSNIPNKENLMIDEDTMTYDLNNILQVMFQPISEHEPQDFSKMLHDTLIAKSNQCNEIDAKPTTSNAPTTNNDNNNEPLNLVKTKSVEPAQQQNKRSAENVDDLVQPNLKVRKIMPKIDKKEIIKVLPLNENVQNILQAANAPADLPQTRTPSITPTNFNAKTTQMKKRSKICQMNENVKRVIDEKCVIENDEELVVLGSNGTKIKKSTLESVDWRKSSSAVTRNILKHIFGIETLATHNLSGKKSPAFFDFDMPLKGKLDPLIIADVAHFMDQTLRMSEKEVKMAVTSACADAGKWNKKNTPEKKK